VLICGECSTQNNDGESFCANCGAYLVWQGEKGEPRKGGIARPDPGDGSTTVLMPKLPPSPDHAPGHPSGNGQRAARGPVPGRGQTPIGLRRGRA
jgi:hypothetical protein